MRQHDAGDLQALEGGVHRLLGGDVEVAGGLVQHQNLRALVQSPRQQHALALAAGQGRAHVADQTVVAHGHTDDVAVDLRQPRRRLDAQRRRFRIEETDVVGDAAGEQGVVLQHRAQQLAVGA